MLTRDIDLRDAILDLLDNCVDGIVRTKRADSKSKTPYKGFFAKITANPSGFVIEDNCGGIPKEIASTVAFRLGRPTEVKNENLETVGMYGIGMKRAIFKLGRNAVVSSEHKDGAFEVKIEESWLKDDMDWQLQMEPKPATGDVGTKIIVNNLYPSIQREFNKTESKFLSDELPRCIQELYAVIMAKGFAVYLNTTKLEPIEFKLLLTNGQGETAINPYVFKGEIGKVHAEIIVGFYRRPLTDSEIDAENDSPKADLSQAGWSVICNDRLILRSDKSAVTGWGTGNVPRFHNQFSSIAGVVILRSTDPSLLPLNTTKRGIETSSDVYFRLIDYMKEGVKQFTDYTNRWKGKTEEARQQFKAAMPVNAGDVANLISKEHFKVVSPRKLTAQGSSAQVYKPELPMPPKDNDDMRRIAFTRPLIDITFLAREMLADEEAKAGQVGEACFDAQLEKHRKANRKS